MQIIMKAKYLIVTVALLALVCSLASAYDPSPLQDFCVAVKDPTSALFVNGKFCKDPKLASANDFFFSGLNVPADTSNPLGSNATDVYVDNLAGLNTLGISLGRIDFAPYGLNPLHIHPRGSEFVIVLEGTLYVGFVTSDEDAGNRLFTKTLYPGDVFVFPIGLIHFQLNVGKTNAVAFSGFNSQNPGHITIANAVFGSDPKINPNVLTKAFQVDKKLVEYLQKKF
ncbi:germin-like protein subfamily 1 member 13 [Juglans microcarpa x Juglans regia]|uniref:germin-like protein subfamily 1 member 13 n=1 Tax=Juglans microcarpa x Juglans regia TaxID=2249226 RepID=UPI001B7DEE9F|nr:germin-like protein subfamily 1 member 13 [Juglans microcarpa x Juglans regia]